MSASPRFVYYYGVYSLSSLSKAGEFVRGDETYGFNQGGS